MFPLNSDVYFDTFGRTDLSDWWSFNVTTPYNILHYVKSGRAYYTADGINHEFREGHLYILSGFSQIKRSLIPGEHFDHMYFDFSLNKVLKNDVVDIDTSKHPFLHSIAETISLFFLEADISQTNFPEYRNDKEILKMAHNFFEIIFYAANSITPLFSDIDSRISKALNYIHKNFNDPDLSIEKLAKHTHLSVPYLNRLFCNETQTTPYKYIMDFRLNHAYKLLQSGEPIKSVAEETCYSSVYSFSKAFKQHFSVSPGSLQPQQKSDI